jgi:hypothetical protein
VVLISIINKETAYAGKADNPYRMNLGEINKEKRYGAYHYAERIVGEVLAVHQQKGCRSNQSDYHRAKSGENAFNHLRLLVAVDKVARIEHKQERGEHHG